MAVIPQKCDYPRHTIRPDCRSSSCGLKTHDSDTGCRVCPNLNMCHQGGNRNLNFPTPSDWKKIMTNRKFLVISHTGLVVQSVSPKTC